MWHTQKTALITLLLVVASIAAGIVLDRGIAHFCRVGLEGGHVLVNKPGVSNGYILVAPYIGDSNYSAPGKVNLMDIDGRVVHSWKTKYQVLYAILQPNGHIYVAMTPPINQSAYPSGGTTGEIQELDWNGDVLWDYSDNEMTHDFEVMPNGDIAYTRWEQAPASFARGVVGGMQVATTSVWTDGIVVVNRAKQIVWQWHMYDHLDSKEYPLGPLTPRVDWAHVNSIRYTADNPITHTPAFLISVRHISTVFFVDAKTGSIIWQSPKNAFSLQHDATLLDNGNVMVFDNGLFRLQGRPYLYSRVVEIDLRTNKIVWEYKGGKTGAEQAQFASSIMGGAQRLPNGNTLITASTAGKIMEVMQEKQIVWESLNENRSLDGRQAIIFKARKYDQLGRAWANHLGFDWRGVLCNAL